MPKGSVTHLFGVYIALEFSYSQVFEGQKAMSHRRFMYLWL